MTIADINQMDGRSFPAKRRTRNIAGGASPIEAKNFAMGMVELEPRGGQVPWHNHEQEEVYVILEGGEGEICLGRERRKITPGQAVYIPSGEYHQLTNIGHTTMRMLYCYGPAGSVDHWKQELEGTLPKAGVDVPPLPEGAWPQCTDPPSEESGS